MTKKKNTKNPGVSGRLYDILAAQRRALIAAGCDQNILDEYSTLLDFLRLRKELSFNLNSPKDHDLKRHAEPARRSPKRSVEERELMESSLDQLEDLVRDETVARKDLERLAIQRFSVPSGSMRSFSNRNMLVGKLLTLIRNEQTHQTIGRVARGDEENS